MEKIKKILKKILKFFVTIVTVAAIGWVIVILWPKPVFGPEEDVELGKQVVMSIEEGGEGGPVLSPEEYPEAYEHLNRIVEKVVASSAIEYRDIFAYDRVRIIHNDSVLNAFCTPGGFIYVYTGLIRYLEAEDHLAGVLGHEIAHAERRHSSIRMQKQFGAERLFELIVLTTPVTVRDAWALSIIAELTGLSYGRSQEAEADDYSVRYLADTEYACNATAGFFEKISEEGGERPPEFLSTHPESENRVRDINRAASKAECSTELSDQSAWKSFQASLPPPAEASEESEESEETQEMEETAGP